MEQPPVWNYKFSELLKQKIALNSSTGWIYCHDGTTYSPDEYKLISGIKNFPIQVHLLKKIFKGTIVHTPQSSGDIQKS